MYLCMIFARFAVQEWKVSNKVTINEKHELTLSFNSSDELWSFAKKYQDKIISVSDYKIYTYDEEISDTNLKMWQEVFKAESDHKCHTCKHYTSGERDGSCGSYICKGYSNWESEEKE